MALAIRDVREHDLDSVLALNNAAGPGVLPIDTARLRVLFDEAAYFRVAEVDGHIGGFLVALTPDADYDSPNFAWFKARMKDFVYIDRIVVARPYRGHGLGRVFYADVQSFAEVRSPFLTCEVFLDPRDDVSVLFHGTYGFREEGQQTLPNGHRVSLLGKELCSYAWVRDTYLQAGARQLPAQPWLPAASTVEPPAREPPRPDRMLLFGGIDAGPLRRLLASHGITLVDVASGAPIPGSYWGEPEAGVIGDRVYARDDTPVHSVLHEASHLIVQPPERRALVHTDATDSVAEEDAACLLQIVLADRLPQVGAARLMADMDAWGYTFRLGSTRAWFEQDAAETRTWLAQRGLPHHLD